VRPEDQRPKGDSETARPVIHAIECKGCGRCVEHCPKGVLAIGDEFNERGYRYAKYAGKGCVGCANCYYTCPEPGAVEVHTPDRGTARQDSEGTKRCQPD